MKNFYFLSLAGCMIFSQAHADIAYPYAQTKSQAEDRYLSAFWQAAQTSHAFVSAFSDPSTTPAVDNDGSARIVANGSHVENRRVSASLDRPVAKIAD